MLSLLIILATSILILAQNSLSARFGLLQLQMASSSQGTFKVLYASKLPEANYSKMIAVSYVKDFDTKNGIVITSQCPNQTETGMGCRIYSENPNKNNIVYVSYIVSCIKSWIVGTYNEQYTFDGINTEMKRLVKIKPNVDIQFFQQINSNDFFSYIIIAGINSVDPDFDLTIGSPSTDTFNLQISFSVLIKEFHNKTVSVTYGYFLFDALKYNILSEYSIELTPENIPKGQIYGIQGLSSQKTLGISSISSVLPPSSLPRNLQIKITEPSNQLIGLDPSNIAPVVTSGHTSAMRISSSALSTISTTTKRASTAAASEPKPSIASRLLRNGDLNNLKITYVNYNPSVISGSQASDGIIQISRDTFSVPRAKGTLAGTNSQLFNTLFQTKGFVILTQTDLTQTYYTEIIAVSDIPPLPSNSLQSNRIYYPTVVENKIENITCLKGVRLINFRNVDFLQRKAGQFCLSCPMGSYADLKAKVCIGFPIIRHFFNQYDIVK